MAFPVFESSTHDANAGTSPLTPAIPASTAEGDLLLAIINCASHGSTETEDITTPAGWTFAGPSQHDYGGTYAAVFWKIAGASESAPSFNFPTLSKLKYAQLARITGGEFTSVTYQENTSSGADQVDFPASTCTADALVIRAAYLDNVPTSSDTPPTGTQVINREGGRVQAWTTTATSGAIAADTFLFTSNKRNIGSTIVIQEAAAATFGIDSTDAEMQRGTDFQVVGSNPATTPSTSDTLSNGNDTLTASSVVEGPAGTWTWTFPVGDLSKQVDSTGYDWTLTVDAETDTTGNIPLLIQVGWEDEIDLVNPNLTNQSIVGGYDTEPGNDTPVTGDHAEIEILSTLDVGVTLTIAPDGVWSIGGADSWVTDILLNVRVVQVNGTIGDTALLTLSAATGTVVGIVRDMVSPLVNELITDMVN